MAYLRHLIGLVFLALLTAPLLAQTPEELARLDPGGLYYQAWSLVKQAEELEKKRRLCRIVYKIPQSTVIL